MTGNDRSPGVNRRPLVSDEGWSPLAAGSTCAPDGHCVTCSDEALPARVLNVDQELGMAIVEVHDAMIEVDITLVDAVQPGQCLLIHGGVIAHLEEQ